MRAGSSISDYETSQRRLLLWCNPHPPRLEDVFMSFSTKKLGDLPDATAPDGSEVRVLCSTNRGSLAHFYLAAVCRLEGNGASYGRGGVVLSLRPRTDVATLS
jgi:hypothetical protein